MKCKCGADMRHQSRGVFYCATGDRFAVVVLGPKGNTVQWYRPEGAPKPYPPMPTDVAEGKAMAADMTFYEADRVTHVAKDIGGTAMKLDAWISGNR